MNRLEALKHAEEHVKRISVPPLDSRGYTVDGWRAPTVDDVNMLVLRTAAYLLEGSEEPQEFVGRSHFASLQRGPWPGHGVSG